MSRPWTLKGIPEEVRNGAVAASERSQLGIAAWVARAILAQIKAEQQASTSMVVHGTVEPAGPVAAATQVAEAIALFQQMREAAGEPPPAVTRAAWRVVADRLKGL